MMKETEQQNLTNQTTNLKQKAEPSEKPKQEQNQANPNVTETKSATNTDKSVEVTTNGENSEKPAWKKIGAVKRMSNKERRRRQNQSLRRLVTPKSALMVLNEMVYEAPLDFRVESAPASGYYTLNSPSFCAEVTIDGSTYQGRGETKTSARSAAAEQAVRDIIIKKLSKFNNLEKANDTKDEEKMETEEEEPVPMIQLASYALHKLFTEWEGEGHHVPQIRPTNAPVSEADAEPSQANRSQPKYAVTVKAKKAKPLPENAAEMHPCMLLSYMRPLQEYREMGVQGDRPQNLIYTIGVDVDGSTFVGQGPNKKEARKAAATLACGALFAVKFQQA